MRMSESSKSEVKKTIIELSNKGLGYAEIGRILSLSRQRVYQIKTGYRTPSSILRYKGTRLTEKRRIELGLPAGLVKAKGGGRDFRRELVRMRDNHTCQICRKVWKEGDRAFDVHHKDGDKRKSKQFDSVEEFENMVTLCHKCHFNIQKTGLHTTS